ncbi:hypothetical protein EBT31_00055 [bacterium]|nr:hypothetical protein [bacterium]
METEISEPYREACARAEALGVRLPSWANSRPPTVVMPDGNPFRGELPAGWSSYNGTNVQTLMEAIEAWRAFIGMVYAEAEAERKTMEASIARQEALARSKMIGAQRDKDTGVLLAPQLDEPRRAYARQVAFCTLVRKASEIADDAQASVSRKITVMQNTAIRPTRGY